jgi:antitoxin (DNA-binding transcriptional repressor) of toxin-antitoxin stability system
MSGEEIVIAKSGKPIARLSPYEAEPARRTPGNDGSQVIIAPDFDEPLPEFEAL